MSSTPPNSYIAGFVEFSGRSISDATRPVRVGVFGPLLGSNAGRVISQGEVLVRLLESAGHHVVSSSRKPRRLTRLVDTATTVVLAGRSIDVAVVEVYSGPAFAMAELTSFALRLLRVPIVLVLHGGNLPTFARNHQARVARLFRVAARVVAPSSYLARELATFAAIDIVPNALPMHEYQSRVRTSARPRLLWMRAFHPIYRPELAVDVVRRVKRTRQDVSLTLAGADMGAFADVLHRIEALAVADAVTCPGFLDPTAKREALTSHDIFLSTNLIDNAPVAVLEAAASGMIVIAMRVGGIADLLIDGLNGIVVGDGDVEGMASAVCRVLDDNDLSGRLSSAAIELGSGSLQASVRRSWTDLLAEVVDTPRAQLGSGTPSGGRASGDGSLRAARLSDLRAIASVHRRAFPDGALSALGAGAVERYYRWLLLGPHDAYTAVAESADGEVEGFVFAGAFNGALTGYVRRNVLYLATRVLLRPHIWRVPEVRDRIRIASRLLLRRRGFNRPDTRATPAASISSFGVLAIAVDPNAQGRGVGAALMSGARREATWRGARRMHLTVHPSNTAAISFYERLGWSHEPGRPGSMVVDLRAS